MIERSALCIKVSSDPITFLIMMLIFYIFPLIFFNLNPFKHQQALHFGVLNYEKQHKEGTTEFQEDRFYFQHLS